MMTEDEEILPERMTFAETALRRVHKGSWGKMVYCFPTAACNAGKNFVYPPDLYEGGNTHQLLLLLHCLYVICLIRHI